jgi:transposase
MTNRTFKTGASREQASLLPPRIEDYVGPDNAVRAIESYVCALDLAKLGFRHADRGAEEMGQPPYDPADLLKLYLYGYINQIRSSRRLEREACRNLELIWLLKNLKPGYRTIANFRKENWAALKATNRSFVLLVRELGLVGGSVVAIDGSFFHGDASKASIFTRKRLAEQIAKLDQEIEAYGKFLEDNDAAEAKDQTNHRPNDPGTDGRADGGGLGAKVAELMAKRLRAQADLDWLDESGETQMSLTDPDARLLVKSGQGTAGYNVQIAIDDKHKLIVASEVVNDSSDVGQLHAMAKAAKDALEAEDLQALADEGYYSSTELKACEDAGIIAYVPPSQGNGRLEKHGRFSRKEFGFDSTVNAYRCPAGAMLYPMPGRFQNTSGRVEIRYASRKTICNTCRLRARCLAQGNDTNHRPMGARRRSRTSSGPDAGRRRPDASSLGSCRAPLRHHQMPRWLSPLPRSRPQQSARRMEPDGALLQLHPRAQHPRLRTLLGLPRQGFPIALTRHSSRLKLHPLASGTILDKFVRLAPNRSIRHKSPRLIALLAQSRRANRKFPSSPAAKNILLFDSIETAIERLPSRLR